MDRYAEMLHAFGKWVARVEFGTTEVNLYRYNGKDIEVWFDTNKNQIKEIHFINGAEINPYLKYITQFNSN